MLLKGLVVLDEIQAMPELFSVLRVLYAGLGSGERPSSGRRASRSQLGR
jgi:hypothetical protein